MSVQKRDIKSITTHQLQAMKDRGEKISMLTAYDYSMASILDDAGVDVLLVGDSASNVMAGHETSLPLTLEKIPADLAQRVATQLSIPIIGIGAGPHVDGQVLVIHDMLGINKEFKPRFLRRYADLHEIITQAVTSYVQDVKNRDFPNEEEAY